MVYDIHRIMIEETIDEIKQVLIGIQLNSYKDKPLFEFDSWKVFVIPSIKLIAGHQYHRNYQINRHETEKIVVRTWLTKNMEISKIRFYYLKGTDPELASYLVQILIKRISDTYPLAESITWKDISKL